MNKSSLTAFALASALALPAAAQLSLPGMKQKEVEKLSKSDIAKELLFKKGDIDACKDEQKKKDPKGTGNLVVRFKVNPDGSTTEVGFVDSKMKSPPLATCLQEKARKWTFSKAKQKSDAYELVQAY